MDEFWRVLREGRNTVRPRPDDRWSVERFLRPGNPEPGFAYTFAGGYIDHPLAFDPAPFGITPREAQQMDPQQRLLLEVTWEALEDAMIPPSTLVGHNVGVFVGGSTLDYQSGASYDPAVMESHFMTGNSLSILSNRISYAFDFRGPSFTTDSACSSSFVALDQAVAALTRNEVEIAIVGGVNLLLSPAPFIGFSQARMLSPSGLSRPFSQTADGYVRAEGAVVFVLRRLPDAEANGERVRGVIVGTGLNSDGRTSGISLPSLDGQRRLIDQVYRQAGVDPDDLAFVEAHGTGTKVGDPIEATAIGLSLGKRRRDPLPIGSVKSNLGHLEAASGLAGLLKTVLALEHNVLPPSLFLDETNDAIDFGDLNLAPNIAALPLEMRSGPRYAGICNYGFGGTNAHVVVRASERPSAQLVRGASSSAQMLIVSAADPAAHKAMADAYADMISTGVSSAEIANAAAYGRDLMKHRLAIPLSADSTVAHALRQFAAGTSDSAIHASGIASAAAEAPVFVYSGNGSQFTEMGRQAFQANARFRAEIEDIDRLFKPLAGWSIAETLGAPIPNERLEQTSVSQPLIYAVQSALTACFAQAGIMPLAVIGHSVGEVAAAETSGALRRSDAVRLIYLRSMHQERVKGLGRMLVVATPADQTRTLLTETGHPGIEIAAMNSATSTTVSGDADAVRAFAKACRARRVATVALDIDYPFHSSALDPISSAMIADLTAIRPGATTIPFLSTVTGERIDGEKLDATYWWNNVRQTVRFRDAIEQAAALEARVFVEIGPRAILTGPIAENLRDIHLPAIVLASLSAKDEADPVALAIARMVANGASFDREALAGKRQPKRLRLPSYPFQRRDHNLPGTAEALGAYGASLLSTPRHPLLGARMADGSPEWRSLIDPVLVPYLDDHRVDGGVIVPAAGLIEIALAAGQELFGDTPILLDEFDVLRACAIAEGETREISVRYSDYTDTVEIWSRKRFSAQEWILHARGRLTQNHAPEPEKLPEPDHAKSVTDNAGAVYLEARRAGLEYGPEFRLVDHCLRDETTGDSNLLAPSGGLGAFRDRHVLHPASLDAAFHGLFASRPQLDGEKKAHLPVRFRKIAVFRPGAVVRRSIVRRLFESDRFTTVAIQLFDSDGAMVASVEAAVLRALYLSKATIADRTFHQHLVPVVDRSRIEPLTETGLLQAEVPPGWLVLRAFTASLAYRVLAKHGLAPSGGGHDLSRAILDNARVVASGYGLVTETGLAPECPFPAPEHLLTTLIENFPDANLEIRLAAHALTQIERSIETGTVPAPPTWLRDQVDTEGLIAAPVLAELAAKLTQASRATPLNLLVTGRWSAGLIKATAALVATGRLILTFVGRGAKAFDDARLQGRLPDDAPCLNIDSAEALATPLRFDGILAVAGSDIANGGAFPECLRHLLAADAQVFIVQPGADATLDFLCTLWAGWGEETTSEQRLDRIPSLDVSRAALEKFGAEPISVIPAWDGLGALVVGTVPALPRDPTQAASLAILAIGADWLGTLAAPRVAAGDFANWVAGADGEEALPAQLVVTLAPTSDLEIENLASAIETLRAVLETLNSSEVRPRVTICMQGALEADHQPKPLSAAIWGFLRVAINEYPNVDLRLIDLDPALSLDHAARRVEEALALAGGEIELRADAAGLQALRIQRGLVAVSDIGDDERSILHFQQAGRLDSFTWFKEPRIAPGDGEIEIEVAAVGLNFRDILVGLGILDDDLLGAGLTAASLGFECSGIVKRVGAGVHHLTAGDPVMGFAINAFASHLTAPAWHFFKVPEGVSLEAAATIPVAFGTAWFSLIQRARIEAGDDVLIHGGAGGVGLAAIQFARQAGARVIATASSEERRAIARAMGAERTYDSRHERFAEMIKGEIGGVDVVLNSLAGPGMLASFQLVRPFGRFVELGKRDYLENTHIGLRPFVRNIAYFGVDLDELLGHDRAMVDRMMRDISDRFAEGSLRALPYRVFEGHEVGRAFRLMQASEHVGKIVIRPSRLAVPDITKHSFSVNPGLHLVVGGTSGFGFETARWLAGKGAGTVVLASRRGQVEEGLEAGLEALRATGTRVLVEALDVTDSDAVSALVQRLVREHGALRGIIHAAVMLDDGMISSLTPERLRAVLAPKLSGAENLAAATDGQPLDYFVVYSSATTIIGSPGQGAYVAANAWLEGFARARRAAGKPALAIGWGAISDVGILARDRQLGQRLRRTTGVVGIPSNEALAHLGRVLALGDRAEPLQFYSNIGASGAAEKLRLIRSPAFETLGLTRRDEAGQESADLLTLIEGKNQAEATAIIVQALRREISHILRMPEDQIDVSRPLGEVGLDSLMALELQLAIERICGTDLPMVGAADRRIPDLAAAILAGLERPAGAEPAEAEDDKVNLYQALSEQHAPDGFTKEEARELGTQLRSASGKRRPT